MKLPLINAVATLFAAMLVLTGCNPSPTDAASPAVTLDIVNHNATTLQQLLASGELTAAELTAAYLARIAEIDAATVNAIVEINPDAEQIANSLDEHFQIAGPKGPLHGLPVILKANVDTGDRMTTSAGSIALADHVAARDAFLVVRLRDAGAVILGKSNMSEWANFRSTTSSSGWSSLGARCATRTCWIAIRVVPHRDPQLPWPHR